MQVFNIDEISFKILALLQQNARMSYTEIGEKIGMASSSVKERVLKLEENGIIDKYTIKINNKKIGYPIKAITLLSCQGAYTPKEEAIVKMLSEYHQVLEVVRITGKNDFFIKVCLQTMEESKEINDKLGKFGQIETSFIVTDFINNSDIDLSKKFNVN
jgi:Lrp/AsnC family leucine-responsive transcriptional regulator